MSSKNLKKVAAGAALVALSGFVPNPFMQEAHAANANINASGSFISGVAIGANQNLSFATLIATLSTGTFGVTPAGAAGVSVGVTQLGALQQGQFTYNLAVSGASLRVSVTTGISAVAGPAPGTVSITRVSIDAANINAGNTFTFNATGVVSSVAVGATGADTMNVGARVAWTGGRPIGAFVQAIGVNISF